MQIENEKEIVQILENGGVTKLPPLFSSGEHETTIAPSARIKKIFFIVFFNFSC